MKLIVTSFLFFLISSVQSQTFNGTGGLIPDDGVTTIDFSINVSGLSPSTIDATFGIETVCIDLNHTWDADLNISLIAPDGTEIILTSHNGADGDNYTNTCFNQSATTSIVAGTPPFTGTYKSQVNLGYLNNGQNGNGIWKLHIYDDYPADQGILNSWSITFGNSPATIVPFTDSNLPIVVINTNSQTILDDPKIMCDMGIIYNGVGVRNYMTDPFNNYDGKIGIELRGSSSQMFPKKTYGFESWDSLSNQIDVSLLGMPAESDWILSASYTDKSLMNNVLAYKLFRDFGFYAPRTHYVELVINGQYQGVYVLMEKIKRDVNRVDISKLTTADTSGNDVTGGYIIKIDKTTGSGGNGWTSNYAPAVQTSGQSIYFQYEYPSEINILPQQENYIQNFVDSFETALATLPLENDTIGWRAFADEFSFIHYFILNELSKNVDGYRLSTYLYKTKNTQDDKLYIGPPWDYDIAFKNVNYCDGNLSSGWAYEFGNVCGNDYWQVPFWWEKMMEDSVFVNNLKCIYSDLRSNVLSTSQLFSYIDSLALVLDEGQQRNFNTWEILGVYVWPNPTPIPTSYSMEVLELKLWLQNRLNWLDANIPGICSTVGTQSDQINNTTVKIYPNPAKDEFKIEWNALSSEKTKICISNVTGEIIAEEYFNSVSGKNIFSYTLNRIPVGIYLISIQGNEINSSQKIIIYE